MTGKEPDKKQSPQHQKIREPEKQNMTGQGGAQGLNEEDQTGDRDNKGRSRVKRPVLSGGLAAGCGFAGGIAGVVVVGLLAMQPGFLSSVGLQEVVISGERFQELEKETGAITAGFSSLKKEIDTVSRNFSSLPESQNDQTAQRLEKTALEIAALQKTLKGLSQASARGQALLETLDETSAALRQELGRLEDRIPEAGYGEEVTALVQRVSALETALGTVGPQLGDLSARLEGLTDRVEKPSGAEKAALGMAFAGLVRIFEQGLPFQAELDGIAVIIGETGAVVALRPAAKDGIVPKNALRERFGDLAKTALMIDNRRGGDKFWEKLAMNAASLVTIRRTGEVTGGETDAVLARMEQRLFVDDYEGVLAESAGLGEPARKAMNSWLSQVRSRLLARTLVKTLEQQVLEQIGREGR